MYNNTMKRKSAATSATDLKSHSIIQEIYQEKPLKTRTSSGLKIKMESVGIHPMEDDDIAMSPARTRATWPKKIIPWWKPSQVNEKPPHSYATLIAHAIFLSKEGRLTLSGIYTWISKTYPSFSIGNGGWQNSVRHNLSLKKNWFCKIDRRPTQKNPGKGCYWTLVAGTEHIFIENLTHETGHSRKHHDIGLTTELSIGQRKGACFYHQRNTTSGVSPTPSNVIKRPSTPLYTTFRMVNMNEKSIRSQRRSRRRSSVQTIDSDNDSGVDINIDIMEERQRKRQRTNSTQLSSPSTPQLEYANNTIDQPDLETNHWLEQSLQYSEKLYNNIPWSSEPTSMIWSNHNVPVVPSQEAVKKEPITINLQDEEYVQSYFHFDQDNMNFLDTYKYDPMPMNYSSDLYYNTLYPPSLNTIYNPNFLSLLSPLLNNQFVSMQDILYF